MIPGEAAERKKLQAAISENGLADSILMLVRAGNIRDWRNRRDLYVLSSRFQGLPMTLAEAMGSGCAAAVATVMLVRETSFTLG